MGQTKLNGVKLAAMDGRCYLLAIDRLPSGRGQGEPLGLMIDIARGADLAHLFVHDPAGRLLFATRDGRGFIAEEKEIAAQTRAGKQVVNLAKNDRLVAAARIAPEADTVACIGTNRKLLLFPLADLPLMPRGRGVILQRHRDAYLADATTLHLEEGLTWRSGRRTRHEKDLTPWQGKRGSSGRLAPTGFPRNNRFEMVDEG